MSLFEEVSDVRDLDMIMFKLSLYDQEKEVTLKHLSSLEKKKNRPKLIKYLTLELSQEDKDDILLNAASNGNTILVDLLFEIGASIPEEALVEASRNGHFATIQYLLSKQEFSREAIIASFRFAARRGYLDVIKLLDNYIPAVDEQVVYAISLPSYRDHPMVFRYLVSELNKDRRLSAFNEAMKTAIEDRDQESMKELFRMGANLIYDHIKRVFRERDLPMLRLYIESNAGWKTIIRYAQDYKEDFLYAIDNMRKDGWEFSPEQEQGIEDLLIQG